MNSIDVLMIQIMRTRTIKSARGCYPGRNQYLFTLLEVELEKFLNLLNDFDPFAVKTSHVLDPSITLFELQLLYLLSEARKKNILVVKELLNWWFPPDIFPHALLIINEIVRILNLSKEHWGPEDQYIRKLLSAYVGRPSEFSKTEKASFSARRRSIDLDTILIH